MSEATRNRQSLNLKFQANYLKTLIFVHSVVIFILFLVILITPFNFGDGDAQEQQPINSDVDALNDKDLALYDEGRYPEANEVFDQALNIDPEHVGCLYNKGLVLEKLGNNPEATTYKDRAQSIDPTYVGGSINKGPAVSELKSVI